MIRLTFVGDIALDKPLLKAAKKRGGERYDFSDVFHTEEVFKQSDLVIGNLETCFGGGKRFNKKPYHYNSPDSFCDAIQNAGINMVSTANNHCIDEGVMGLKRTLQVLDERGIEHTGTFSSETQNRYLIKNVKGVRIAFYSLTYSVNTNVESVECDNLHQYINLIGFRGKRYSWAKNRINYLVKPKIKQIRRRIKHKSTITAHTDSYDPKKINKQWMQDVQQQLKKAKKESEVLIVLLHCGGQFNTEPGEYTKAIVNQLLESGTDIIIGNHSHTIQQIEKRDDRIVAYSLGGYCMSVSGEYVVKECLPEYSLALHVDIDESNGTKLYNIDILKGTEDEDEYLQVRRIDSKDPGKSTIESRCRGNLR